MEKISLPFIFLLKRDKGIKCDTQKLRNEKPSCIPTLRPTLLQKAINSSFMLINSKKRISQSNLGR